jgi:phosphocarrier protein
MSIAAGWTLLTHSAGLHARPTLKLTMLAKTFAAKIEISLDAEGPWIDAKSVVKVMAMKAPNGSTLYFRADGDKAADAVSAILQLVERDFDDAAGEEKGADV